MKFLRILPCIGVALVLAACADGGGESGSTGPGALGPPLLEAVHANRAPLVALDGRLHVGADVGAPDGGLARVSDHGAVPVSHGILQDGVGAGRLIDYLEADTEALAMADPDGMDEQLLSEGLFLRFGMTPPTVRVAEGTPAELVDEAVRAVQAINAALPRDWQLGFVPAAVPSHAPFPPEGEILITFADEADWPFQGDAPDDGNVGVAESNFAIEPTGDPAMPFTFQIVGGRIWVDPSQTAGLERPGVIAHEIIHLLGRNHVDPARFPGTIMVAGGSEELTAHILHPLDRAALLAVYGVLDPGVAPGGVADALGPWSDSSLHVRGALHLPDGEIAFGAALANGLSQPWATGPAPDSTPADNAALSGSALWHGRLLGLTPDAETVAGAADLTVDLTALTGRLDFSGLEHWPADAAPGAAGTGIAWRDGALSYPVALRGNTFASTGGHAGTVTGAFFGAAHEGMGGTLQRDDLSAGFGGRVEVGEPG